MARASPTPRLPFQDPEAGSCLVGVALDVPLDTLFTYRVPTALAPRAQPGRRALVPFRRRTLSGIVVERQDDMDLERVLDVKDIPDEPPLLDAGLLGLGQFVARYYGCGIGEALTAMLPRGVRHRGRGRRHVRVRLVPATPVPSEPAKEAAERTGPRARILRLLGRHPQGMLLGDLMKRARVSSSPVKTLEKRGVVTLETERRHDDALEAAATESVAARPAAPSLTADQAQAVTAVEAALAGGHFAPFLLFGVTGSGKTEVYLRGIRRCIEAGRQAIVLVPEIALTPQTVRRFRARFERVVVVHSALTDAERARAWRRIRAGEADVVIGPRSAIFAPVPRLGLLVVDEEHEGSFKQQSTPRYHARDVGLVRARDAGAVVILGSATPALETWRNALEGRYGLLRLPERIGGRPLPPVQIVDLRSGEERRGAGCHLSRTLAVRIGEALRDKGQVILLQNRRGFATSVACQRCGWVLSCRHCDVSLTYHKRDTLGLCHLCGHEEVVPPACPDCALPRLRLQGVGTQTVEAEVQETFPEARIARMDSDSMATREAYEDVLGRFGRREIDVLVGTQMIAKGLHFPHVTLVGIVSADTALSLPDFRSAERTFSLVAQVAGRAGRGEWPGRVVVQTLQSEHSAIRLAASHDYEAFARAEVEDRRIHGYPPWRRLLRVLIRGADAKAVEARAEETAARVLAVVPPDVHVLGPAPPTIERIEGRHRRHLLVKASTPAQMSVVLDALRRAPRPPRGVEEMWDVDPQTLA